jgi:hypothetical protein
MTDQEPEDGVDAGAETPSPPKRTRRKPEPAPEPVPPVPDTESEQTLEPSAGTSLEDVEGPFDDDDEDFLLDFDEEDDVTPDAVVPLGAAIAVSFGVSTLWAAMSDILNRKKPRGITPVLHRQIRKSASVSLDALNENQRTDFLEEHGRSLARLIILLDAPVPKKTADQKALASLMRSARRDLRKDLKKWEKQVAQHPVDDLSALLD